MIPLPFPRWLLLVTVSLHPAAASPSIAAESTARRPNILFILVDDQSPFDVRFYNPKSTLGSKTPPPPMEAGCPHPADVRKTIT